jgi:hypothetical protein
MTKKRESAPSTALTTAIDENAKHYSTGQGGSMWIILQ